VPLPPLPSRVILFVLGAAARGGRRSGSSTGSDWLQYTGEGDERPGTDVACTSASSELLGVVLAFASLGGTLVQVVLLQQRQRGRP
jgi:hypothetical protein